MKFRMRKAVWLIAFAVSALLFGAADGAFAHSAAAHAHSAAAAHTNGAVAAGVAISPGSAEAAKLPGEFLSSFDAQPAFCPHGQNRSDCGSCAACAASFPAAITSAESVFREYQTGAIRVVAASPLHLRQAVFELNRPPKSFA